MKSPFFGVSDMAVLHRVGDCFFGLFFAVLHRVGRLRRKAGRPEVCDYEICPPPQADIFPRLRNMSAWMRLQGGYDVKTMSCGSPREWELNAFKCGSGRAGTFIGFNVP